MSREVFHAVEVKEGDVVCYKAVLRREHNGVRTQPLRVSRIEGRRVWGYRVDPEEWEREVEFVIEPLQIEENGLVIAE